MLRPQGDLTNDVNSFQYRWYSPTAASFLNHNGYVAQFAELQAICHVHERNLNALLTLHESCRWRALNYLSVLHSDFLGKWLHAELYVPVCLSVDQTNESNRLHHQTTQSELRAGPIRQGKYQ